MRRNIKPQQWDSISSSDKSYLLAAYQRYKDLLQESPQTARRADSFSTWLSKRGIFKIPAEHLH